MNKTTIKRLKNITIILLWVIVITSCYNGYKLYQRFQEYPQTEFYTSIIPGAMDLDADVYDDGRDSETEDMEIKLAMMGKTILLVRIGILLVFVVIILDYFYKPEDHFITWIMEKIDNYSSKEENEGEDKNEEDRID